MGLFSQIKQLFCGNDSESTKTQFEAIDHKGFTITAAPIKEGSQYRVGAMIEKNIDGELKQHRFIRSDVCVSEEQAVELAMQKCRLFIDQMGAEIFK
jgi:hypothetical protein